MIDGIADRIEEELGNRAVYGYKKIARNFKA